MTGSGSSDNNGGRTVFRPSPLSIIRAPEQSPEQPRSAGDWEPAVPHSIETFAPPPIRPAEAQARRARFNDDDIPRPAVPLNARSPIISEAGPVLALAASIRSGRARVSIPEFHREVTEAIAAYDRAIAPLYPDEVRQRARYALCATVDDIAQNLPDIGQDGTEWARRSLVVTFFRENIGGDRVWQLVDHLLQHPGQNAELIELYHACLAAGFEGRFRVTPDGRSRLQQIMASLYGALDHPRSLSAAELSPEWKGVSAPLAKVSAWNRLLLAGALAAALLLAVYIILQLLLNTASTAPERSLERMLRKVGSYPTSRHSWRRKSIRSLSRWSRMDRP
jgi:type IV/VI secretion system ImpK/VasF family protein